ncbi:hypothetical protein EUGRSUZ_J00472 [Eucalyptus grandis]|uniref:Uncharacterized protein n=2 Tax=Eucalyptus grandis TaxID=71139 RepID=A0A059AAW9_EUCGR|nr:hypothetical protein EUGRSUZ_J00472 [Eucalyptus grandis]
MPELEVSPRSTSFPEEFDEASSGDDDAVTSCLGRVGHQLEETSRLFSRESTSPPTIFRFPQSLTGVNWAEVPEIVSIGPYYRKSPNLPGFRRHKLFFLQSFLRRSKAGKESLVNCLAARKHRVRSCYSEPVNMTSAYFLEMMLLDCCFVLELLQIFDGKDGIKEGGRILRDPWIIPVVIRDLLKLGNQVPFFILVELSLLKMRGERRELAWTKHEVSKSRDNLCRLALGMFSQVYPICARAKKSFIEYPHHLLHLFYSALLREKRYPRENPPKYPPKSPLSDQSIPCVTKLWHSGIKFKSVKTNDFLGINLRKRVLEIPSITIDDSTTTMLINCLALEQSQGINDYISRDITDYISFMYCLISQPKDVSLLCSNGIITRFSHNDQYVANFFNELRKSIAFNVRDCHLSKQFEELESYYNSNWAYIKRTYFSSPWSVIAVFFAFLGIALTAIQTVYAVLGYHSRSR